MDFYFIFSLLSVLSAVFEPPVSTLQLKAQAPESREWADSVYNTLSERQRVAQLVIPTVSPAKGADSKASIKALVEGQEVGGLLLSKGSLDDYAEMIDYAQSISRVPLMITFDGEWGLAMRIPETPQFPYNMTLGAITRPSLLRAYGAEMARECKLLGIQVNFAPDLDVNTNPENPVIGKRSFGELPGRVGQLGTAYGLGLETAGVMAVGKHFPGHGDTNTDSHKTLPTLERDLQSLDSLDLPPFVRFIRAGLSGIMMGHLAVPCLDSTLTPASLSEPITTGLLKDKLKFKGVIFTDALAMEGATLKNASNCVEALKAGATMLLNPRNPAGQIDSVLVAIDRGEISKATIEANVKKALAYKHALGLGHYAAPDREGLAQKINTPEAHDLITRLYEAAITVARNDGHILPLSDLAHNTLAIVNIGGSTGSAFDLMCHKYAKATSYDGSVLNAAKAKEICEGHATVVCAVYSKDASAQHQLALFKEADNVVCVFMLEPYDIEPFASSLANAKAIMVANTNNATTQRAAAMGLFAGIEVDGRLPVAIPGVAPAGAGCKYAKTRLGYATPAMVGLSPKMAERIDSAVTTALADGAFTGAQVIVGRYGDVVYDKSFGRTTKGGAPVTDRTLFDLASVSKTVGTLPGVMKAYDLGLFNLDEPVSDHVPGMNVPGKSDLTARQLLYHESGIKPSLNMFEVMMDTNSYEGKLTTGRPDKTHSLKIYNGLYGNPKAKLRTDIVKRAPSADFNIEIAKGIYGGKETYDTVMARIYNSPVYDNRNYRYSCLNFSLLMDLEQQVTGQPHYTWVTDSVWAPIGAYDFCYRPEEKYPLSQIAATEKDVFLRRQHLQGFVHDELAAFSGGVQGNAGVFGTATDLAKLCQTWLNGGYYGDARVFSEVTNTLFTTDKSPTSHRGLGFDKPHPDPEKSNTCAEAGSSVYGHTGFTGTVFWVDPEEDLFMIFLCNRVDPTRNNAAFARSAIRPTIMSIVYQSIE